MPKAERARRVEQVAYRSCREVGEREGAEVGQRLRDETRSASCRTRSEVDTNENKRRRESISERGVKYCI